ncbi:phage integrase N-terminal SAM-like domain-containing protein [uncultured Halovibrio sp.]|uniref:phage integrase N-terminal SAM-like domain-containing protein n=1 Tax=uncultured Halovibrio sp. TaxID=985049 RepID=UPI0025F231D6|nr:phage integrase N-terminal SAM-like domain-containing protein [uncultured Halovibrio sp.]
MREQVGEVIRVNHYSSRTEKSYWYWIRYFIRFHQMRHPSEMGAHEVRDFLTWLAVHRNVAAATQNQALNALVFLYGNVLNQPLGEIGDTVRATKPARLPVVLKHAEATADFSHRWFNLARVRSRCQSIAGNRVSIFGE